MRFNWVTVVSWSDVGLTEAVNNDDVFGAEELLAVFVVILVDRVWNIVAGEESNPVVASVVEFLLLSLVTLGERLVGDKDNGWVALEC